MGICVCMGAMMQCSFGMAPATLIANSQPTVMVASKPIALKAGDQVTVQEGPAKGRYHVTVCHVLDAYKNEYEIMFSGDV